MRCNRITMRDAAMLIFLAGMVILTSGALQVGGSMRAKTLMCTTNLGKIGQAMAFYTSDFDGKLPLLEYYSRNPNSTDPDFTPCIESNYLISKRGTTGTPEATRILYRHLGCLYGAGYLGDGQLLFCPVVVGWRGEATSMGANNGTYLGAVHPVTGQFADITPGVSQPNQGWKAMRGYCYWPLSIELATETAIHAMPSSTAGTRYVPGLPLSATKADDLLAAKPLICDRFFHGSIELRWSLNTLYPDGRVVMQPQPMKNGLGMYSLDENNQFSSDIWRYPGFIDPAEAARNLPTGVTPTEFAWALQP
jgi:hypothetical protein